MSKVTYWSNPSASFDSSSMTPETTQLFDDDYPDPPIVYYTPEVAASIDYLVQQVGTEVGWLGTAEQCEETGDFEVTQIFVPRQEVHGAETDIDAEAICELAVQLEEQGIESDKLIYWGHSHVTMGVSPSGQDEQQIESFLENGCKQFIRGIYNKFGDSKVDVYDVDSNCVHQCVKNMVRPKPMADATKKHLDSLIKQNVKKKVYKPVVKATAGSPLGKYTTPQQPMFNSPNYNQNYPAFGHTYPSYIDPGYYDDDVVEYDDLMNNPFYWKE